LLILTRDRLKAELQTIETQRAAIVGVDASACEWYRIDLLIFHRRLRCLVVIDLKIGKFTHVGAGQMHLNLNYAREHWNWLLVG
jgi:predicted nuclease of restriction endonuclease-like (RecB) superfamily